MWHIYINIYLSTYGNSYKTTFTFSLNSLGIKESRRYSTWMRKLSTKTKYFVTTHREKLWGSGGKKLSLKPVSELNSWSFRICIQVLISSQAFEKLILNLSQIHCFNYAKLTPLINPLYSPLLKVFNSRILIEPGPKWKWCHLHHPIRSGSTAIKLIVQSAG